MNEKPTDIILEHKFKDDKIFLETHETNPALWPTYLKPVTMSVKKDDEDLQGLSKNYRYAQTKNKIGRSLGRGKLMEFTSHNAGQVLGN